MRPKPYRLRTWLRGWLPEPLSRFFPKGADCGDGRHEWYLAGKGFACYHCRQTSETAPFSEDDWARRRAAALFAASFELLASQRPLEEVLSRARGAGAQALEQLDQLARLTDTPDTGPPLGVEIKPVVAVNAGALGGGGSIGSSDQEVDMAKKPSVHTTRSGEKWVNKVEGGQRASSTHDTKAEAVQRGRDLARDRKTEHIIHNKDGKIGERNSYGNDPHPPKG